MSMPSHTGSPLIEAAELRLLLGDDKLVILDSSPSSNISGLLPVAADRQIQGARSAPLKEWFADKNSPWPNMLPGDEQLLASVQSLGLENDSRVVVYDNLGIYSAPRLWWILRSIGHDQVQVLNGGMAAWMQINGPTQARDTQTADTSDWMGHLDRRQVWTRDQVIRNLSTRMATVVDARSAGRFGGQAPEPRAGWPSGHIPASRSLPWKTLLQDGYYLPLDQLKEILHSKLPGNGPLVFSCGSGLTACVVYLAAHLVWPARALYLYDGSWAEWAAPGQDIRYIALKTTYYLGCYTSADHQAAPDLSVWEQLGPRREELKAWQVDDHSYSIHDSGHYWAAMRVYERAEVEGLSKRYLPPASYAVGRHRGPAADFRHSLEQVRHFELPIGYHWIDGASFERLPPTYSVQSEDAQEDIWLPIAG